MMEPAELNPAAMGTPVVQMSEFVLEQEIEESVASDEEEDWDEAQCPALVACGHMTCAKAFRAGQPEPVRFGVSSFIGSLAMFVMYKLELIVLPEAWGKPRITFAYATSYAASIWMQHWLHSTLVYGWKTSYVQGLITTYAGYGISYVASLPINYGLVLLGGSENVTWALTLFLTGCVNYFLFQRLLGGSKRPPVTPRGLYNPPVQGEAYNGLDARILSPAELHQQQLDTASNGTGRQMAAEYRKLKEVRGVSRLSNLDRFYVWVASW